jgi:hypothetical protein
VYGICQLEDVCRVQYVSWEMYTKDVYSKICQLEMCTKHNKRCVLITIISWEMCTEHNMNVSWGENTEDNMAAGRCVQGKIC